MADKKYGGDVVKEIQAINDMQAREEARNPLAAFSTLQLKAELARRKVRRSIFRCGIRF